MMVRIRSLHNNAILLNRTPAACVDMELRLGRPGMAKFALKGPSSRIKDHVFFIFLLLHFQHLSLVINGKRECQHFEAVHCQLLQNSILFLPNNLGIVCFS